MTRFNENTLRLKSVIKSGTLIRKTKWENVSYLKPIDSTDFPDIKEIKLKGSSSKRPAEVKFTTSIFNYHNTPRYAQNFQNFISNNGFIIVLNHDQLPKGLKNYNIDVYELDKSDFITYCRENFNRLLNRQIRTHTETKIWLMYQGPNFNNGTSTIKPARKSGIWCPTENLTGFDLAPEDKVLFVKTKGASTQIVQRLYSNNQVVDQWYLDEIYLCEVKSLIHKFQEFLVF